MNTAHLENCFVKTKLSEPIRLLDRGPESALRVRSFFTDDEAEAYLADDDAARYSTRFICVCQRNSWQPLQATGGMLRAVAERHTLGDAFWDLVSCFYGRNLEVEEGFVVPFTRVVDGGCIDMAYSLRYAEYKSNQDEWTIRQSAVYHRLDLVSQTSLFILFSPTPEARAYGLIDARLRASTVSEPLDTVSLHQVLFSAYLPAWRRYIASHERRFLPMANTTFATFIDEPLRVGYDNLSAMAGLESRFLAVSTMLSAAQQVLSEAATTFRHEPLSRKHQADELDNLGRRCVAYGRAAAHLRQRAQTTGQLLAATLSLRDQVIAKEQNGNMLQLNKSAVFVTTLTLVYAPASFVASFFGMNFFAMDQLNSRIVATPMIWIYIVAIAAFTAATVAFYYWLVKHDDVLFRRLAPKVGGPGWRSLARRLTRQSAGLEMEMQNGAVV
ncbi:Mg2+ transporter protein, CorA-like/Zinc transport protein ZntB [Ophiocordyceps camponoti-floridani]|uniref:Mg2+ transporter protein, CorA-like/Zinc transport protein ZntB n=1 Tax=Ophiocordyceps camponoti-floridani TaxID=2030778 RepID=A0A8H4Q509_9HYPO|nr:Mg2+ transporter protein, CorA-like/Zinc transport protein ZntB [Ophiocordyceps camponoti-floridani]